MSCNGRSENFEGVVFENNERFVENGVNFGNNGPGFNTANFIGNGSGCNGGNFNNRGGCGNRGNNSFGRNCDLYWQGFMAGFYSNNGCNQSAAARTAAQAAERTAEAANRGSCWSCNNNCNCR